MRIWDIHVSRLCRQHLLGEHRELHGLYSILQNGLVGYSQHPETIRWQGKQAALARRHESLVAEMERRGYRHGSPLSPPPVDSCDVQDAFIDDLEGQRDILMFKGCACHISGDLTQEPI